MVNKEINKTFCEILERFLVIHRGPGYVPWGTPQIVLICRLLPYYYLKRTSDVCAENEVCVREWEMDKSNVFHSKVRVFLCSSRTVRFFWEVLQYAAACQKDSHSLTHTHTQIIVSHSRTWHWVGGREDDEEREWERWKQLFIQQCSPHNGQVRALLKHSYLSASLSLLFSCSLSKIIIHSD